MICRCIERKAALFVSESDGFRTESTGKKMERLLTRACSVYYEIDVLLRWNYKHIANILKKNKITVVNLEEGYNKPIELITPMAVIEDDRD